MNEHIMTNDEIDAAITTANAMLKNCNKDEKRHELLYAHLDSLLKIQILRSQIIVADNES